MRIDGSIPPSTPSIPFHLAKAYGAAAQGATAGAAAEARALRVSDSVVIGTIGATPAQPRLDTVEASGARELVAGQVPGRVDFSGPQPRPSVGVGGLGGGAAMPTAPDALPMYRAPWDRNTAAVAVQVGRSLDVNG